MRRLGVATGFFPSSTSCTSSTSFGYLVQSHAASPELKNGGFVLNNHGQIVKVLTQSEYLKLKGEELRLK